MEPHTVNQNDVVLTSNQTLQEIGTMMRRGLKPYIFVLNNDGYEIERQIHGWAAEYNNIQPYDHQLLLPFFAGKKAKVRRDPTAIPHHVMHTTRTSH
jgi:TPP-dependent 2-oxoacid decarboxylase